MIHFTCSSCGKELELEGRIYKKAYEEQSTCLDCRPHGGKREGAGRKSLGTTKKVSITLPDEIWLQIEEAKGVQPLSAFLRNVIINGNWI
jgi:hypothetical protein